MKILSLVELPPDATDLFTQTHIYIHGAGFDAEAASAFNPRAVICSPGGERIDAALLERLPRSVEAVATYSVGHDHIDLQACQQRGLAVFNTPDVLAASVADVAMLLILAAARRVTESVALIREKRWSGWKPTQLLGQELAGRTLGILGMGGVGSRIADRARAFGLTVAYTNRSEVAGATAARFVKDPRMLFAQSDIFVLACPSTAETRKFVNASLLQLAKPNLILVNVGRGDLVDDGALISALLENRIFAAGLDVFDGEPDVDPRYFDLPNLFMLPHIGTSTQEARFRMALALFEALQLWEAGSTPDNRLV